MGIVSVPEALSKCKHKYSLDEDNNYKQFCKYNIYYIIKHNQIPKGTKLHEWKAAETGSRKRRTKTTTVGFSGIEVEKKKKIENRKGRAERKTVI